jgi:hypothetical protein
MQRIRGPARQDAASGDVTFSDVACLDLVPSPDFACLGAICALGLSRAAGDKFTSTLSMWPRINAPLLVPAGEVGSWFAPIPGECLKVGKSRTRRHRGEPRPKVGKKMRRIAAAPRGLLAPGGARVYPLALSRGASLAHYGDAPADRKTAESASETKDQQRAADSAGAQSPSVVSPCMAGVPAVEVPSDPVHMRQSSRRAHRRATSLCGGSSASLSSSVLSRRISRSKRGGTRTRTLNEQLLIEAMTCVSKPGDLFTLITLCVMIVLPFIMFLVGFSVVPLLLCEPDQCLA